MISTTLFIPFYLKEREEGDYLKKGFKIDSIIDEHFPQKNDNRLSFLKIGQIDEISTLPAALLKTMVKGLDKNNNEGLEKMEFFKKNPSIIDKKYLSTIDGFYDLNTPLTKEETSNGKHDKIASTEKATEDNTEKEFNLYQSFTKRFQVKNLIFKPTEFDQNFKIGDINFIFNKSNNKGLAFGFISINIDWIEHNENSLDLSKISQSSSFYRYFDDNKKAKIKVIRSNDKIFNGGEWNDIIDRSLKELKGEDDKNQALLNELKTQNPEEEYSFSFRELVEELLSIFLENNKINDYLYFEQSKGEKIKPSILHLVSTNKTITDESIDKTIFKMLRIPEDTPDLNIQDNFDPKIVDNRTRMYFMSEGACVIESENNPSFSNKVLENKYYISFLFALNQRILFHFFQKRINALETDSYGYFIPAQLRRLKGTLINGDFIQVFSSISNYHEIDYFYQNMREIFKIKQLREEFLTSIESIEKIVTLAEDKLRLESIEEDEKKLKLQNDKLNTILLILTGAQVWSGIYSSVFVESKLYSTFYYINLTISLIVLSYFIYYAFSQFLINKKSK